MGAFLSYLLGLLPVVGFQASSDINENETMTRNKWYHG